MTFVPFEVLTVVARDLIFIRHHEAREVYHPCLKSLRPLEWVTVRDGFPSKWGCSVFQEAIRVEGGQIIVGGNVGCGYFTCLPVFKTMAVISAAASSSSSSIGRTVASWGTSDSVALLP